MDIDGGPVEVKMIWDGHFDISSNKDKEVQPFINRMSWCFLGRGSKANQQEKGIKVPPGKTFDYRVQKEGCSIYVFEAGLDPKHVATIGNQRIHIYVTYNKKKIFIATLSSSRPKVQLDLMMTEGVCLSHTALRKVVYFNAFEFKPMRYMSSLTKKELWVTKIKPFEERFFNPIDDGKSFYLLKAFSAKNTEEDIEVTEEDIDLHVRCGGKLEKIGRLSPIGTSFFGSLEYDHEFSLSHTSRSVDVIFFGYTVPDSTSFKLKKLPDVTNQKLHKLNLRPPKKSDDPENSIYEALAEKRAAKKAAKSEGIAASGRGDAEHQTLKLTKVSLLPAPLISGTRFSFVEV